MKKFFSVILTIVLLIILFSCESTNIFNATSQDYIDAGRQSYKQYRNDLFALGIKNTESKDFAKAESYFLKAHELEPNSYTPILEFLEIYWNENLPEKFCYWIDVLNNTENNKYDNYVYSAEYCIKLAKMTNVDIWLHDTNYNVEKMDRHNYPNTYSISYVEEICKEALKSGQKSFGTYLWEKTLECLDNAFAIKETTEVLNLYSEVYKRYGKEWRITGFTRYGKTVTDVTCTVNNDLKKSQEYLQLSMQLNDNWEAHYKIFRQRMLDETGFTGGYYDEDKIPINARRMWIIDKNVNRVPDILLELDKAIDLAEKKDKAQLIYEKANIYFYSFRQYDKAKEEYIKCADLNYNTSFVNKQIFINCDKQKNNDLLYQKCASLLKLNNIDDYLFWKSRTNYNNLYRYLNIGSRNESYKQNDLILMPAQLLSIVDVTYQNGNYIYLVTSYGINPLSKYCKIVSPIQINYISYYENLITDSLLLRYIGEDAYKNNGSIISCDVFQNIVPGTNDFDYYNNVLTQIDELEKQIKE